MTQNNTDTSTEAEEEKKKKEVPVYRSSENKDGQDYQWAESKNGGAGFNVDADPNYAQVNQETGVVTIYPDGMDKDPSNTYTLISTEQGTESDYSTVPLGKTAEGVLQYGDRTVFTTNVDEQGNLTVEIQDRELFQQKYAAGDMEFFKNPQGEVLTLNRDGELVEASADSKMLFGKTGAEREAVRDSIRSADIEVTIAPENSPTDARNTDDVQLASGAGAAQTQELDSIPAR